jgi:hypothetical protein
LTHYEKNELYERINKLEEIVAQQQKEIQVLLSSCRIGREDLDSYLKLP